MIIFLYILLKTLVFLRYKTQFSVHRVKLSCVIIIMTFYSNPNNLILSDITSNSLVLT